MRAHLLGVEGALCYACACGEQVVVHRNQFLWCCRLIIRDADCMGLCSQTLVRYSWNMNSSSSSGSINCSSSSKSSSYSGSSSISSSSSEGTRSS